MGVCTHVQYEVPPQGEKDGSGEKEALAQEDGGSHRRITMLLPDESKQGMASCLWGVACEYVGS